MKNYISLHKNSQSAEPMEVDELEALMDKFVTEWNKLVKLHKENQVAFGSLLKGVRP